MSEVGKPNAPSRATSPNAGHRARLREKLFATEGDGLADYEVIEFLLFGSNARGDTKPAAKALIAEFGSLNAVLTAPPEALRKVKGVSDAGAGFLKIVEVAAKRLAKAEVMNAPVLSSWDRLITWVRIELAHRPVEEFHLLFLDKKNKLIAHDHQGSGTIDQTPVYVRNVAKRALEVGASAVIMVHNHPSGDPEPSRADILMTKEVIKALEPLNILVHDHLIVGKNGETSFKSQMLI